MNVDALVGCDTYRDGGSLGIRFIAEDGIQYEFVTQAKYIDCREDGVRFEAPIICRDKGFIYNEEPIRKLTWEEGDLFVQQIVENESLLGHIYKLAELRLTAMTEEEREKMSPPPELQLDPTYFIEIFESIREVIRSKGAFRKF